MMFRDLTNRRPGDLGLRVRHASSPRDLFSSPFERLFDGLLEAGAPGAARAALRAPRADVRDTDAAFVVELELPGVAEDDVELSVLDGVLTIAGEKKQADESEQTDADGNVRVHVERSYGRFERRFALPENVDAENAEAAFQRGVLRVTLPKVELPDPVKRIPVRAEG